MKRTLSVLAATVAVVGFGVTTAAADYPVDDAEITTTSGAPTPGSEVTIELDSFCPNETLEIVINPDGSTLGTVETDATGHATFTFTAPATGEYTITASSDAQNCDRSSSLAIVVGNLPTTGGDTDSTLQIGAYALVGGALLVGAAALRRRRPSAA